MSLVVLHAVFTVLNCGIACFLQLGFAGHRLTVMHPTSGAHIAEILKPLGMPWQMS